jgi:hypothetical protein
MVGLVVSNLACSRGVDNEIDVNGVGRRDFAGFDG